MPTFIAITDYVHPPFKIEAEALGPDYRLEGLEGADHKTDILNRAEALLVWHQAITQEIIDQLDSCKVVVRYGVGFDAIDIKALERRGIAFCNTPDYGTEEVADTAVALLLQALRRLPEYDQACRVYASGWQEHTLSPLKRSNKTTIGVIGIGRIGTAVVNRLKAFGFRILGFDPYLPSGHEKGVGYERCWSLDDLLGQCDAVTLHCPLNDETNGLVDGDFISKLKPGAILVNTARGGLIASLDPVHEGLKSGQLKSVGLDVLPSEPPVAHPLIQAWRDRAEWLQGRVVITPHTAYFSEQAWYEMRFKTAETAKMFLETGQLRNQITSAGS